MPVFESSRKVQLFGSSLAMTLPALFVKTNEVAKGSVGKVYFGLDGVLVVSLVDDNKVRESLMKIIEKIDEICLNQSIKEDQNVKREEP
jgi:antitoxin component of MazEF toxin-antitoxin module